MNRVLLLSNLLLQNRQQMLPIIKKYFFAGVLFALMMFGGAGAKAQLFWNTNGTGANITATNWGTIAAGPFTTPWAANSNINFTAATNNITYFTTTQVGNITISNGATVNLTAAGTYSTGALIRTIDIGTGGILNWNSQRSRRAGSGAGDGLPL